MSAPDTKLATQKRRHRGPLIGITIGLLFGAAMMAYWAANPDVPNDGATTIQGESAPLDSIPAEGPAGTGASAAPSTTTAP